MANEFVNQLPTASTPIAGSTLTTVSADGINLLQTTVGALLAGVSVNSVNGFAGTNTASAITLSTSITGLLKGVSGALAQATAGTDYVVPSGSVASATNLLGGNPAQIVYQTGANTTGFIAAPTVTGSALTYAGGNTFAWGTLGVSAGGTGATSAGPAFNNLSPVTSVGDLIIGNGSSSATRLPIGSAGSVLTSTGTTATWQNPASGGGTVISVSGTGTVNGLTLTGTVTTSGSLTLGGTLTGIATSALASVSGTGSVALTTGATLINPTISNYLAMTGQASAPTATEGSIWYNSATHVLQFDNDVGAIPIGETVLIRVYNNSGSSISAGQPVSVSGAFSGLYPTVALASANTFSTAASFGLAYTSIANNTYGYVVKDGLIGGINTAAFTSGAPVYVSTTAGTLTATAPAAPYYAIQVGIVVVSGSSGSILVAPSWFSAPGANIVGSVPSATASTYATLSTGSGATNYVIFSNGATGQQSLNTISGLQFNATTGALVGGINGGTF